MLAASGSSTGASRALFQFSAPSQWTLLSSTYALAEVLKNLNKLPPQAASDWNRLRRRIIVVKDVWTINHAVVFAARKDRPILFSAYAWADLLLTLDKSDFQVPLGKLFYGLPVMDPAAFLERERAHGRLCH